MLRFMITIFISDCSNYGPTVRIQQLALHEFGCQQVMWLYGKDHYITEVGTMNLFMFWTNEQGGVYKDRECS